MNLERKILHVYLCIVVSLFTACSTKEKDTLVVKKIDPHNFDLADLKDSLYVDVSLLKLYANEKACNNKTQNANLYICKNIGTGDTLYVFETCAEAAPFAKENLHENFAILIEDVKNKVPDSVNIMVPSSFKIPSHAKFVFSNLTRLED